MMLVDGERGVGKSRFWEQVKERSADRSELSMVRGLSSGGTERMGVWRSVFKALTGQADLRGELQFQVEQCVFQHSSTPWGVSAFLSSFFDWGEGTLRVDALEERGVEVVFDVLAKLLYQAAMSQSVIVCLDEMENADEMTLYFIQYLMSRLQMEPAPIGVVMLVRSDPMFAVRGAMTSLTHLGHMVGQSFFSFKLSPLSEMSQRELIAERAPLSESAAGAINEICHGNPWLIMETLAHALDTGGLVWDATRWSLPPGGVLEVPPSITRATCDALERLSPGEEPYNSLFLAVLQWVSLLGGDCERVKLRTALRRDPRGIDLREFEGMFEALVSEGLIEARDGSPHSYSLSPAWVGAVIREIALKSSDGEALRVLSETLSPSRG